MIITNFKKQSWFCVNKKAEKTAEIMIYNDIGMWGINEESFKKTLDSLGDVEDLTIRISSYVVKF